MVGVDLLVKVYQNSGPALLGLMTIAAAYIYKSDIKPRLQDVEQTQEERRERWESQQVNSRERAILIEDAHERVDDIENTQERLQNRLREIEQKHAAEHGDPATGQQFRDQEGDN